ncbi:molybdopterin-dependent oxidoreductase [Nonomuraea sp. KM88]|uniref:molybdopterin-dependent oxidoreductase n=1 Tax=Nonomuraea sp. KM88 TaxID=3457427 RepID=UPI003FCC7970
MAARMTASERYSVCNLCEAVCGLRVRVQGEHVVSIKGLEEDPLSHGHICPKGVALADLHHDPDRLRRPVRRVGDEWHEVGWDEAFDLVAGELSRIRAEHGPDAVGAYLGNPVTHSLGAMTHAPAFVDLLRTSNKYSAGSADTWPAQLVALLMYGHQWLLPIPDVDRTHYLLVFGANPIASNGSLMTAPGFPRRLREMRGRGGKLVVFDPRRTETAKVADEHHFIRPSADAAVLLAMVNVVLEEGLATLPAYADGLDEVRRGIADLTPALAARWSGVDEAVIRRVAREFAMAKSATCYSRTGLSTQRYGALAHWAVQLLNIVTGNLDRPGGLMFTRPAVDGIDSGTLAPGHVGSHRSRVRGLPDFSGEFTVATLADEIETPGPGQIRALLTVAGNPVLSSPGGHRLNHALAGLEFMAAIDFYVNETTRHAHVILPPTGHFERDHYDVLFNALAVRNTARFSPALFPRSADARHEWEIFQELARRYRPRGTMKERLMLSLSPNRMIDLGLRLGPYRLSLRKLRRNPAGIDLGSLRPALPERLHTPDKRIDLAPRELLDDLPRLRDSAPEDGELLLIGRRHLRDNNSWMHNSGRLIKGAPRHHLLVNPADLAVFGLNDGDTAYVRSRSGRVMVEVKATDEVMRGVVSLPHGYGHQRPGTRMAIASAVPGASANDVTDPGVLDDASATAVLNGVPVRIEPVRTTA